MSTASALSSALGEGVRPPFFLPWPFAFLLPPLVALVTFDPAGTDLVAGSSPASVVFARLLNLASLCVSAFGVHSGFV